MNKEQITEIVKETISRQLTIEKKNIKEFDQLWNLGADYLDYAELIVTLEDLFEEYTKIKNDEIGLIIDKTFSVDHFTIGFLIQEIFDYYNKVIIDENNLGDISTQRTP